MMQAMHGLGTDMKTVIVAGLMVLGLASCATYNLNDGERLALYQAHAGAPVLRIDYRTPIGWTRVDDQHVALDMRPSERWLLTLSGPCLRWDSGAQALVLEPIGGMVLSKFDLVRTPGSGVSCRIEEIRPIDVQGFRVAEQALIDKR